MPGGLRGVEVGSSQRAWIAERCLRRYPLRNHTVMRHTGLALTVHGECIVEQSVCPPIRVEFLDHMSHESHALGLLRIRHAERLCKHVRRFVDRVRVYHEGRAKLLGRSCKLAENEDAALIIARTHKFLRDEVHSVMEAPYVADISGTVHSVDIGWFVMRFQQNDGTADVSPEAPVHALSGLYECGPRRAVCRQTLSAWFSDLHEDEASSELWVNLEQALDREKLFIDALRVVQAINPDAHAHASRQLQVATDTRATGLRSRSSANDWIGPFDTDRIGTNLRRMPAEGDHVLLAVDVGRECRLDGVKKLSTILACLKSHDVAAEQSIKHFMTPGTDLEHARDGQGMCQKATTVLKGSRLRSIRGASAK